MRLMLITGAGISTGAGLSTYRGKDGRYTEIEREAGMPIEQLLTPETLASDPHKVWSYWLPFSLALKQAEPSAAHLAIVAMEKSCESLLEVTQNVDGLSLKAGLPEAALVQIHGTYHRYLCTQCKEIAHPWLQADMTLPPKCYRCNPSEGSTIRPDVVMFGEDIDLEDYGRALDYAATCNVLVIAGTSLQFTYLLAFITMAAANGAVILYVDPQASLDNPLFLLAAQALDIKSHITEIRYTADEAFPLLERLIADRTEARELGWAINSYLASAD